MDKARLDKLKDIMCEMIDAKSTMGVLCIVVKNGKEEFYHSEGYRNAEEKLPFTRDTLCNMYSLSKVVTSTACMMLIEEGLMTLTDPVSKFLPEYSKQKCVGIDGKVRTAGSSLTIENLLNMTSGMPYPGTASPSEIASGKIMDEVISKMRTDNAMSTREIARRYAEVPLSFEPSDKWEYGVSADILGAVIETITGLKYSDFLKERLFDPLKMTDTGFYVPEDKLNRFSNKYMETPEGLKLYDRLDLCVDPMPLKEPAFVSGGAGVISTADDYLKLMGMLLNKGTFGGIKVLSEKTVEFMTTPRLNDIQKKSLHEWESLAGFSYGNLMRIMDDPGKARSLGCMGEYGWDSWTGCYAANVPSENMTVMIMRQRGESCTDNYIFRMRNVIFSAL